MRKKLTAAACGLGLLGGLMIGVSPAAATTTEGQCYLSYGAGDACFYYLTNLGGSMVGIEDFQVDDVESPWVTFVTSGSGQGLGIGNAAGSERNGDYSYSLRIWEHHNETGLYDTLAPAAWIGHGGGVTINNERSYEFV